MGAEPESKRLLDKPWLPFILGAGCLLVVAGIAWIVASITPAHSATYPLLTDAASHFCRGSAIFGICAAIYSVIPKHMNGLFVRVHFWLSIAAVLSQPVLAYSFSQESAVPGHSGFSLLMDSLVGTSVASMWALLIFLVAQLVFVVNICYSLIVGSVKRT